VKVFDMKTRKGDEEISDASAGTLRLNSRGSVAWLTAADGGNQDVHAWDRDGHRVLDTGAISKLRLRGAVLSWRNGDQQRSQTLR
jgi:hypothetical protein